MITNQSTHPQTVRWGPSDARPAGIRVWNPDGAELDFVNWTDLKSEVDKYLIPQLFENPEGFTVATRELNGKKDWLVQLFDKGGSWYCDVWFGGDQDNHGRFDGLVRVGDPHDTPHVWQTYQRYSDGTYRRLSGRAPTIDELARRRKR